VEYLKEQLAEKSGGKKAKPKKSTPLANPCLTLIDLSNDADVDMTVASTATSSVHSVASTFEEVISASELTEEVVGSMSCTSASKSSSDDSSAILTPLRSSVNGEGAFASPAAGAVTSWHSEDHLDIRNSVMEQITTIFKSRRPNECGEYLDKLPAMVKPVEDYLYQNASSLLEFSDFNTLKVRLSTAAKIAKTSSSSPTGVTPSVETADIQQNEVSFIDEHVNAHTQEEVQQQLQETISTVTQATPVSKNANPNKRKSSEPSEPLIRVTRNSPKK
jgi:hypothetical protein